MCDSRSCQAHKLDAGNRTDERLRLPDDEQRVIVTEIEVAQQQMEGVERSGSTMMDDNHQFIRESTGIGEAVPKSNYNLALPLDHSRGVPHDERVMRGSRRDIHRAKSFCQDCSLLFVQHAARFCNQRTTRRRESLSLFAEMSKG